MANKGGTATETPYYNHIWKEEYQNVYEPAEDTFLLLDSLEADQESLRDINPKIVLEVGVGSGVVLAFARKLIGSSSLYIGTDINPSAVRCAQATSNVNKCQVELIQDNLVTSLQPRLNNLVDVIIFNPPYVLTDSAEVGSKTIQAAWAGGETGREVTDQFLPRAAELLSEKGLMYLVLIDRNRPDEVLQFMQNFQVEGKIIASRKAGIENLLIIKFWRKNNS